MTPAAGLARREVLEPRRLVSGTVEVQLLGNTLPSELPVGMNAVAHTVRLAVRPTDIAVLPERVRLEVDLADDCGGWTRVGVAQVSASRFSAGGEVVTTAKLRVPAGLAEGPYRLVVLGPALPAGEGAPSPLGAA